MRALQICLGFLACVTAFASSPSTLLGVEVAGTRPRLLLRADDATIGLGPTVSEIRTRRNHPDLAPYARLRASDSNWEGLLTPALQTLLSGDLTAQALVCNRLLEATDPVRRSVARQAPGHMAIAFDWIYETLKPAQRSTIAANIRTGTDQVLVFLQTGEPDVAHNFTYMALFSVTMAGLALWDEPGYERVAQAYLGIAREWLESEGGVYDAAAALDGAWPEGNQYAFSETTRLLLLALHALRTATAQDPFVAIRAQHDDFMRGTARFYMAMTRPDLTFERLGDMNQFKPLLRDQHRFVIEALAAGLRGDGGDARVPGMLAHFSHLLHSAYGGRDTHRNFDWGMLLFADPSAPRDAAAYVAQPLAQVFGRGSLDLVVFRHGWDEDGTAITFVAGDHFLDHQHFDKGAFTIYHRGGLALDTGAYDRMYSAHHRQYATRTIAHNAPLVFDPQQPLPAEGYKPDGGQRVIRGMQHHARWTDYLAHREREHLDAADLRRFESGRAPRLRVATSGPVAGSVRAGDADPAGDPPGEPFAAFAVAQAELSGAYGPRVRGLRRTLAYWPAAQIVLVDDAYDLEVPLEVAFQVHTGEPPFGLGTALPAPGDVRLEAVPWWVVSAKGSLDLGEQAVIYDGRMFLRTLMPAAHVVRRVGGRGSEFVAASVAFPPAGNGAAPRESGAWRVEVRSPRPATRHRMVHALQIADDALGEPSPAALLESGPGWRTSHVTSAPEVALCVAEDGASLPLRYEISTVLPCIHVVVGLPAGREVSVRAGEAAATLRASAEGILAFHDPEIGPHRITLDSK